MNNLYINFCPNEEKLYEEIYGEDFFKLSNCSIKAEDVLEAVIKDLPNMNGCIVIDSMNLIKERGEVK